MLQILLYVAVLIALTKPMGAYMARVFQGERTWLHRPLRPVETAIYHLCGIDETAEQHWTRYAGSLLAFSVVGVLMTYVILRLQQWFPLNPAGLGNVGTHLAFNTAVSFGTNTNWQSYVPETTMSYLSQMVALATHNFFSAAAGIAVAIALVRGFARHSAQSIGNFWVDMTRATVYVLLPISIVAALLLCSQGVIQNFHPYTKVATLEGAAQTIPQGPVASQEAIKMLGTNGGGFFNANSAHPYENPTPFSNFLEMLLIFLIPAGLTYTFGKMVRDTRQGWALFAAMLVMFLGGVAVVYSAEMAGNPILTKLGVADTGNMEGKEARFGIANSALFTVITTDASCGAVNTVHDSLTPLGGLVPLVNMELGEVIFGGVGAGLYGMLLFAILAVFLAGLMVGRTPEYLGKKIQAAEMKLVVIYLLAVPLVILAFAGASVVMSSPSTSILNPGPHGLSEVVYAFTSTANNNGSAFAGLNGNTDWYNVTFAICMIVGRFVLMIGALAIAGSLARKQTVPESAGTFPTDTPLFTGLLVSVIVVVVGLTYLPVLALGPIVEHLSL